MLTGFHGYDTDICLQIFFKKYRVVIDRKLEIIHYSPGCYNKEYALANKKIKNKWNKQLPIASQDQKLNLLIISFYNILCWAGYLRNMIIRKLKLPIKLR